MAEIREVVSEQLQATIRRLLPSQRGFTEDLQASNVITPIIDLTPSAEGSSLPLELSSALSHGSNTSFNIEATTTNIVNNTGFYRVFGTSHLQISSSLRRLNKFQISDGTTTKIIWEARSFSGIASEITGLNYDFIVFLQTGDTLQGSADTNCILAGSTRQIADVNGNIVNPSGFTAS